MDSDSQPSSRGVSPYPTSDGPSAGPASRSTSTHSPQRRPSNISVPSFNAFRRRTPSGKGRPSLSAVRSKPSLEDLSSPSRPTSLPSPPNNQEVGVINQSRPASVDSPTPRKLVHEPPWRGEEGDESPTLIPRNLDIRPDEHPPVYHSQVDNSIDGRLHIEPPDTAKRLALPHSDSNSPHSRPSFNPSVASYHTAQNSLSDYDAPPSEEAVEDSGSSTMLSRTSSKRANLTLQVDGNPHDVSDDNETLQSKIPKSPGAKITGFFGWKQPNQTQESPNTPISDRSVSPSPSANIIRQVSGNQILPVAESESAYTSRSVSPYPYPIPSMDSYEDELVKELREITTELAASIRREMELEDEVERYKLDMPTGPVEQNRRTSDYFSDSGTSSSLKMPLADSDTKIEGLEKMRRKAEQEKAQVRLDMSDKVQEELNHRRALEMHVQSLESQLRNSQSAEEYSTKSKELEASLEDAKRRLNEEKQFKENFEDLLAGMREEIESYRNERDNLRDEVVPQLRSRIEGLEAESAKLQSLSYDNSKLQQENQSLRNENQTLANARRTQLDMQQGNGRFNTISEEDQLDSPMSPRLGLGRSNSLARSKSLRQRSNSQSKHGERGISGADGPTDSFKDVEDQRDALHRTLKALILRQENMSREHAKQLKKMENERDRALDSTPRRAAFKVEVQHLRSEVNYLRRRADDAMEQKWQCEKGLSGLKMDLDRAQQETTSLRDLLDEHDIFIPDSSPSTASSGLQPDETENLDQSYAELRSLHEQSAARLQPAEAGTSANARVAALSTQIEHQLSANRGLRTRLADAITRGENEQKASADKINDLQSALRAAEERLVAAQSESEEAVARQEEHVKAMRDALESKEKRGVASPLIIKSPPPSGKRMTLAADHSRRQSQLPSAHSHRDSQGAASILETVAAQQLRSPLFATKSPRLERTTSGAAESVTEASKTEALVTRVRELEQAASKADAEMQGVVEKMNRAQIEVGELQTQRDEAMRQTRRLQREIVEERERMKALLS